jgi:hypothetical protein
MNSVRYIGLDVHRDTISAAVLNESGRLIQQSILATRAAAILDFIGGMRGTLHVTFEEGTHSAWLYDLLSRRVARLVVCNPRKNALMKSGNKSDAIDARKLAELLRADMLSPVYHGEKSAMEVQHLARSYALLTEDTTRVMARIKAVFRGQAIACAGKKLYGHKHRDEYLAALGAGALRRRAELLYQELEALQQLRRRAKRELIVECRKHAGDQAALLSSISGSGARGGADRPGADAAPLPHQAPVLGLLRAGVGDARQRRIPRGRRTGGAQKKAGADSRPELEPQPRAEESVQGRGDLGQPANGVFREFYLGLLKKNMQPEMARLTLARKIAAIALKIWKKGEAFDAKK